MDGRCSIPVPETSGRNSRGVCPLVGASEVGTRCYLVRVPLPFSPTPRTLTHALAIPAIIIDTYFLERQVEADCSSFL